MIRALAGRFAPWALLGAGVLAAALYVQHVSNDRDGLRDDLEEAQQGSALWQKQYALQRAQADRLVSALDDRAATLDRIEEGVRGSRRALDRLGEQNADIQDWLDRPVPAGIADWLRILQQPDTADGEGIPGGAGKPHSPATSAIR